MRLLSVVTIVVHEDLQKQCIEYANEYCIDLPSRIAYAHVISSVNDSQQVYAIEVGKAVEQI